MDLEGEDARRGIINAAGGRVHQGGLAGVNGIAQQVAVRHAAVEPGVGG